MKPLRYKSDLYNEAKTLRQGVFARIVDQIRIDEDNHSRTVNVLIQGREDGRHVIILPPGGDDLNSTIEDIHDSMYKQVFENIPIIAHTVMQDPELHLSLQDLGFLIGEESTSVFREAYYPAPVDVAAMSPEHVKEVMEGMQREIDREATRRRKSTVHFLDLTPERQQALAERRRMWYGKYGITPESWKTGVFSMWDVSNENLPEWYNKRF